MSRLQDVLIRGLRIDQPLPTDVSPGTVYVVIDEAFLQEQSDGAFWEQFGPTPGGGGGGGLDQLTGDVAAGPGTGSQVATIQPNAVTTPKILNDAVTTPKMLNGAVTNAKLATVPTATIKGRTSTGTGVPEDLTTAQATALLTPFVGDSGAGGVKGLVPAPAAGDAAASKFLKADGTFAIPPVGVSGITQLTGDVTAGPGSSVQAATIVPASIVPTSTEVSRPAPGRPGRLFLPNDGYYIERDTGTAWAPWGPLFPMTAPVDADFAWVNQGGASVVTANGGIYILVPPSPTQSIRFRQKAAPATPYTITAGLLFNWALIATVTQVGGLVFRQSSDGKVVFCMFGRTGTGIGFKVTKNTNPTTFDSFYYDGLHEVRPPGLMWLRIADTGTNRTFSYSFDGVNFNLLHSVARTDYLTADQVGFGLSEQGNVNTIGMTLLSWKQT